MMKKWLIILVPVAVLAAPLEAAFPGPLRGPVQGRRVRMRGPITGRPVSMRGPVRVKKVQMRRPVWAGNNAGGWYYSNSRLAYTRTGVELYENVSQNFTSYRQTQFWNDRTRWGETSYRSKVQDNIYRVDR